MWGTMLDFQVLFKGCLLFGCYAWDSSTLRTKAGRPRTFWLHSKSWRENKNWGPGACPFQSHRSIVLCFLWEFFFVLHSKFKYSMRERNHHSLQFWLSWFKNILSFISVAMIKYPEEKKQFREERIFSLTVAGYSPSLQRSHSGRNWSN